MPRWICVLALALALAGCTDAPDDEADDTGTPDPGTEDTTPPEPMPISLPTCRAVEAFLYVDPETTRPLLPEGFAPAIENGRTLVILGGLDCHGQSLQTVRFFAAILVQPTHPALEADGTTNYFWEPEHILRNGTAYANASAAFGTNHTTTDALEVRTDATTASASATVPTGEHRITATGATVPGPVSQLFGHFREYYPADGGYAYLEATFGGTDASLSGASLGQVQTAPDTPARALIGAQATTTVLFGDNLPYDDATLGFVAWPQA